MTTLAPHVAAAIARGHGGAAQAKPAGAAQAQPAVALHVAAAIATGRGGASAAQGHPSPQRAVAPHVARAFAPHGASRPVIQRMEEERKVEDPQSKKRKRKINPLVSDIIDITGEKQRSRGKSVLEKAIERKEEAESSKKKEKKEKRLSREEKRKKVGEDESEFSKLSAPIGVFLMFGERTDVSWAVRPDTGGLKGNAYVLDQAQKNGKTQKDDENTVLYYCGRCQDYWPTKGGREKSSKGYDRYITVDHSPPFSQRLEEGLYDVVACDGAWHWKGVGLAEATRGYNDPKYLGLKCNKHNSKKGGLTDYSRSTATPFEKCSGNEKCKIYGQKGHKALASDYELGNL